MKREKTLHTIFLDFINCEDVAVLSSTAHRGFICCVPNICNNMYKLLSNYWVFFNSRGNYANVSQM